MKHLLDLFQPDNYHLTLDINQKKQTYQGVLILTGQKNDQANGQIKLDAVNLQIKQVIVNKVKVNFTYDQKIITIPVDDSTSQQVEIKFSNTISKQMYGIYPCSYDYNGQKEEIIATQFESHYARYAFPCIDEPAAKATFDLTLITDSDQTVLSNTPVSEQVVKRNRQLVRFETTPKMSIYTLGFVIGRLIKLEGLTKSGVQIAAYASRTHQSSELEYGLQIAIEALDWYEQYFGVPYPLAKCDHVALPDFAAGAMENWGLVTYREALFLTQPNTPIEVKTSVATVITHELAHMWFGNLVTMYWWDELWLNESLASILETKCLNAIRPGLQVDDNYYANTLFSALRRDSLPGVQPIVTSINQPEEISAIFDGAIVYAKGACLMHMIESWVGTETFRTGLQIYLQKHALTCANSNDFLKIFDRLSNKPISQVLQKWLKQAGFPLLTIDQNWQLSQQQFGYKSSQTWQIPLIKQTNLNLEQPSKITHTLLNPKGNIYAVVHYHDKLQQALLPELINGQPVTQYYFLTCQLLLAERSYQTYAKLVPHITQFSTSEHQLTWLGLARIINNLKNIIEDRTPSLADLRQLIGDLVAPKLDKLGLSPQPNESINYYRLRHILLDLAITARQSQILKALSTSFTLDLAQVNADLRSHAIIAKLLDKPTDTELIQQLLSTYQNTTNPDLKDDIMTGLTWCQSAEDIQLIVTQLNNRSIIKPQDIILWYAGLIRHKTSRDLAWSWLQSNFINLINLFQASGDYADFVRVTASVFNRPQQLAEFCEFFTPYRHDPALQREIEVGTKQIKSRVELIAKQQDTVAQALRSALSSHNKSSTVNFEPTL